MLHPSGDGVIEARVQWVRAHVLRDQAGRLEDLLGIEGNVSLAGLPADRVGYEFRAPDPAEESRASWIPWREFLRLRDELP